MSLSTRTPQRPEVLYPECDGQPLAENTLKFQWIVTIKEGLHDLLRDDPHAFVAGSLFWYPVEGDPTIRTAPDVLVVFGRPQGYRGSYRQWEEGGIAPQVVFEVLSPGNRPAELIRKFRFYERYGVEEFYICNTDHDIYDPEHVVAEGWRREGDRLEEIAELDGWTSPRLGIRFDLSGSEPRILRPDGRPFLRLEETERPHTDVERRDAEAARRRVRVERLDARLRELGMGPDD